MANPGSPGKKSDRFLRGSWRPQVGDRVRYRAEGGVYLGTVVGTIVSISKRCRVMPERFKVEWVGIPRGHFLPGMVEKSAIEPT